MKISNKNPLFKYKNNVYYKNKLKKIAIQKRNSVAVVIHLYYFESWELIADSLSVIQKVGFDLYISMPPENMQHSDIILQSFPKAQIIEIPNRGRDVLPFVRIARILDTAGYTKILKLHSKKSTHRTDGLEWFSAILESLIPKGDNNIDDLCKVLDENSTGIIGPAGQYIPLTVNFDANGMHMTKILNKLYSKTEVNKCLQLSRKEYGFFAGTMFWARVEAIRPLLKLDIPVSDFEEEKGQIDGTTAHALERLFCIVPELEKRNMYEIDGKNLRRIDYMTNNIPDWSDVYIGPKE